MTILGIVIVVWAVTDWWTLEVGIIKPIILGAGSVHVQTTPEGAEVLLDGVARGRSPLRIDALLTGNYMLQARHRFHPPYVREIAIARGDHLEMVVDLVPAFGVLLLATNPAGARTTVDGEPLDQVTPLTIDPITAGEHDVKLEIFGRATINQSVDVLPDDRTELVVELNLLDRAELTVRTNPAHANVRLFDVPVDYAPKVILPVGDYRIEVSATGYRPNTQMHRLRTGVNVIDVTLQRAFGALTVRVLPSDAQVTVRVGDDLAAIPYHPGVKVPTGAVEVRAQKVGFRTQLMQFRLDDTGKTLDVRLERHTVVGGETIQDALRGGGVGPRLIVVPAGGVDIGERDGTGITALQKRSIMISDPFAISVTEITLGQFRRYTESVDLGLPSVRGMDTDAHPIANVSWRRAVAYTQWLTRETGKLYRLPIEHEWAYVAIRGATTGDPCQRGNIADQVFHKVFRRWRFSRCDDGHVRSAPVGGYRANYFGVRDMLGNVAEWVSDCGYVDCTSHVVRGSAWDSSEHELRMTFRESYSSPGDTRGIRVVREL